ncbi:MAG: hypothetical protein ACTSP4_02300 [Candidatus Hodarchaeales archaeon]
MKDIISNRENNSSLIKRILDNFWGDLLIISAGILIFLLYMVDSLLRNDFFHLDNYWIALFSYQLMLFAGLVLTFTKLRIPLSKASLYAITILMALFYIFYSEGLFGGDITLGVIDGAETLFNGGNPYDPNNPCCRHGLDEFQHYATYPYLPVDVIFYALTMGSLHTFSSLIFGSTLPSFAPSFNTMGILIVNSVLMLIGIYASYKTFPRAKYEGMLVGFLVIAPFLWNNVTLSTVLVICGLYYYQKDEEITIGLKNRTITLEWKTITIVFFTLAALSKYFAAIFIVAILIEYFRPILVKLHDYIHRRQSDESIQWKYLTINTIIPAVSALAVMIPFNFFWVFDATFGFYNSNRRLEDLSMGGTIVSEIARLFSIEELVGILSMSGFLIIVLIALFIEDSRSRLLFVGFASLNAVTGFSAQFIPMMFFFLVVFNRVMIMDFQKLDHRKEKPSER